MDNVCNLNFQTIPFKTYRLKTNPKTSPQTIELI